MKSILLLGLFTSFFLLGDKLDEQGKVFCRFGRFKVSIPPGERADRNIQARSKLAFVIAANFSELIPADKMEGVAEVLLPNMEALPSDKKVSDVLDYLEGQILDTRIQVKNKAAQEVLERLRQNYRVEANPTIKKAMRERVLGFLLMENQNIISSSADVRRLAINRFNEDVFYAPEVAMERDRFQKEEGFDDAAAELEKTRARLGLPTRSAQGSRAVSRAGEIYVRVPARTGTAANGFKSGGEITESDLEKLGSDGRP